MLANSLSPCKEERSSMAQEIVENPNFNDNKNIDKNGEEILFEGICNRRKVFFSVCCSYFLITTYSFVGVLILIPLAIAFAVRASRGWRLYLTRRGIHYFLPNGCFCCCDTNWVVPYSDFDDILITPGTTDSIWLSMEPSKIYEYVGKCNKPLCCDLNYLVLSHVENAEEFVNAVKREKAAAAAQL